MAENKDEQLTDEELAQLQLAEENENAVERPVQEPRLPHASHSPVCRPRAAPAGRARSAARRTLCARAD